MYNNSFSTHKLSTDDVPPPEMNPDDEWDSSWNCSEVEVFDIIRGLDNQSAVGLDDISPRTLKNCHEEIVPARAALINRSFAKGKFPSSWKHARISPIPKVPGTSIISEHRPISVLPSLSKVAERCLLRQLRPYIFNPPNDNQFAYLNGRSVDDALATVQFYVSAGFAACPNSTKVAVLSLDISKAFDQVPKNSLVKSLKEKEVPGAFLRLLDSYLSDRQQTVRIGVTDSKPATVGSGVAQGSILGPNLFISYISEILAMNLSQNTRHVAYADDLLLMKPIVSDDDCTQLQRDLDTILEAYSRLFLSINPSKSSLLLCTLAEPHMAQVLPCEFVLQGTPVSRVPELKYLGVTLDHKLNFSRNAQLSSAKAKKAIGALWRTVGRWSGRETFKRIFTSKVLPILTHGLPMVAAINAIRLELL
ncbi:MAG: reverse transcriptase family protein [Gammaproteobacteria bacterium]|nr:reverse transcriptase family protein [Gammaproteobacteria bacterium]